MNTGIKKLVLGALLGLICAITVMQAITLIDQKQQDLLFAQAEQTGRIREELVEKARDFEARFIKKREKTGKTYPKIVPDQKDYPVLTKKFTYSQSMVQLTLQFTDETITLTPNSDPTKKWFWNNGKLSDKSGTSYQVTYNDKTYTSILVDTIWRKKNDDNAMDYLTYYMYLKDNNQPIDMFLDHMIKQVIEKNIDIFGEKSEQEKMALVALLKKIILEEEKNSGAYVFYNGYPGVTDLLYDFVTILYNYLNIENRNSIERIKFGQILKIYNTVQELIKEFKLLEDEEFTTDWDFADNVISSNIGLFGNIDLKLECSLYFFLQSEDLRFSQKVPDITRELCTAMGFSWPEDGFQIDDFADAYAKTGGRLKQIFIKSEDIDTVVYLSKQFGVPFGSVNSSPYERCLLEKFNIEPGTLLSTEKILDLLRTDPKNFCFIDNPNSVLGMQARILHFHPLFFESRPDIDIRYYYTQTEKISEAKKLKQKLARIVRGMIWSALESGTLKPEDVKLKALYTEMKKPLPTKFTLKKAEFKKQPKIGADLS